jgi:hypothetical protein
MGLGSRGRYPNWGIHFQVTIANKEAPNGLDDLGPDDELPFYPFLSICEHRNPKNNLEFAFCRSCNLFLEFIPA